MFLKNSDAVVGPGDMIVLPEFTEPWIFMHEAELALVIKGPAKKVSQANWQDAVFGYTCLIDVSARGEGRRTWKAGSWLGKSFDTFAPIGPCIATTDEIADPHHLSIKLRVNGQTMQDSKTDQLVFGVPELIEFLSRSITLEPGDVIATGTPPGVGFARKPPVFMKDGDVMEVEIEGLGVLRNPIVAAR